MTNQLHVLITLTFLTLGFTLKAQYVDSVYYSVTTTKGNTYYGLLVERTAENIVLKTEDIGKVEIPFEVIEMLRKGKANDESEEVASNSVIDGRKPDYYHHPINYNITSSGYGLKSLEGYYKNIYIFYNELGLGFGDYFSTAIGFIPIGDAGDIPVWAKAHVHVPIANDHMRLGLGSLNAGLLGNDNENFGVYYGSISVGDSATHITVGAGKSYLEGSFNAGYTMYFAGSLKVTKSASMTAEAFRSADIGVYNFSFLQGIGKLFIIDLSILAFHDRTYNEFGETVAFPTIGVTIPFSLQRK